MQAWVEVRAEAAKKEITIEAYPRIIYVEPRDWYPPPSNVPEVIPPEYFERDDIMIGPAIPPVIYDSLGGPFSAPWAHPVVVLKAAAAKSHAVQQCVAWLVSERKSGPPNQAKAAYIDKAKWRFGISEEQFRSIWREVARRVPRKDWGKSAVDRNRARKPSTE
jgi:hypothetical protein